MQQLVGNDAPLLPAPERHVHSTCDNEDETISLPNTGAVNKLHRCRGQIRCEPDALLFKTLLGGDSSVSPMCDRPQG